MLTMQVKLLAQQHDYEACKARVHDTQHAAAATFLACTLTVLNRTSEALPFYTIAGRPALAAAAAARVGLWKEAQLAALQADAATQLRTAELCVARGAPEYAGVLFQAAGAPVRSSHFAQSNSIRPVCIV